MIDLRFQSEHASYLDVFNAGLTPARIGLGSNRLEAVFLSMWKRTSSSGNHWSVVTATPP
jgi:hypothetical protein